MCHQTGNSTSSSQISTSVLENHLKADSIQVPWLCGCLCVRLLSAQWHPVRGCFLTEWLVCWQDSLSVQVGELPMSSFHCLSVFAAIQFLSFTIFLVANQALLSATSMFHVFTENHATFYPSPVEPLSCVRKAQLQRVKLNPRLRTKFQTNNRNKAARFILETNSTDNSLRVPAGILDCCFWAAAARKHIVRQRSRVVRPSVR